jgi:hypothetical protein
MGPLIPARRPRPWAAAGLLLWGTTLCFLPLLNLLAFEFAFFTAIPMTFIAGRRGARLPESATPREVAVGLLRVLGLAALPLLPITLNALRVRNCNYLEGLAFHGLLPGVTAVVAFAWGRVARHLAPRWPMRLFVAGVLLTVVEALHHFWTAPPVDAFHPFVGYFPGSLYDEVIPLNGRLVGARAIDLVWAVAGLCAATALRGASRRALRGLAAIALGAAGYASAEALDLHRDAAHVQAALGGLTETAHFRMRHPADLSPATVAALTTELEFRHAELTTFFGKAPAEPIDVWFYASTPQKKRLMGAGQVRIAKPWQRAVHLQLPDVGDGILAHELAHAFSAEISAAPHHLSLTPYLLPNMGLIEGLATAAAWDDAPLDAHQWTQAMRGLGVDTPLTRLLSPTGFLAANSRAAYTQCGSYVRWLRDTEGPGAVERLYRAGALTEAEAAAQAAAWGAWLDTRTVDADALAIARLRFDRPAIFGKVCAHEIAALRARVDALSGSDPAAALSVVDEMLVHLPDDPETLLLRVTLLYRLGDAASLHAALALATALAARDEIGRVRQARAREWQADILSREGRPEDRERVRALYADLLNAHFDRAWTRRLSVKHAALGAGAWGDRVLALLTRPEDTDPGAADALLAELAALSPGHPVTLYLQGRAAARHGDRPAAIRASQAAVEGGLPHPTLTFEALRLVAACRFDAGDYAAAAEDFAALAERTDLALQSGEADGLRTWARRARFFAANPPPAPPGEAPSAPAN